MIRAGNPDDLAGIYDVWYQNQIRGMSRPPEPGDAGVFEHELATGDVLVAARDDEVVGFAAVLERGGVSYLAELFVDPDHQSSGIGRRLLGEILEDHRGVVCTLSSSDPRALGLYVRAGMQPWWPNVWLLASSAELGPLDPAGVVVEEADANDSDLIAWDAEVSGRARPAEHDYWVRAESGTPLWLVRGGRRVGYAYVRARSPVALWNPEAATLGPIGARSADDARACVAAVVSWTTERAREIRFSVPGPHPALRMLIDAGCRVVDHETFLSSSRTVVDPGRYVTSGDQL